MVQSSSLPFSRMSPVSNGSAQENTRRPSARREFPHVAPLNERLVFRAALRREPNTFQDVSRRPHPFPNPRRSNCCLVPCLPLGCCYLSDWMAQTSVVEKCGVSKTIFADCFSLWLRGQDAGSPGDYSHSVRPCHGLFLYIVSVENYMEFAFALHARDRR